MTYSIASESLGGGVCFQACLLVCKGLGLTQLRHHHQQQLGYTANEASDATLPSNA